MGKRSKGKLKLKTYAPPSESKFLVVINPIGYTRNNMEATCNRITAWFERMIRDRHPDIRPSCIYHQSTHANVIVEIPSSVNVERYLGAHHYNKILTVPTPQMEIAYIYEYNFRRFNHPENTGWNAGYHTYNKYTDIPPGCNVVLPYPRPDYVPIPPSLHLPYVIDIPAPLVPMGMDLGPLNEPNLNAHDDGPQPPPSPHRDLPPLSSHTPDEEVLFHPYEPPSHYRRPSSSIADSPAPEPDVVSTNPIQTKCDPYEDEEAAEKLLRSPTLSTAPPARSESLDDFQPFIKPEAMDDFIPFDGPEDTGDKKPGFPDTALNFLDSIIPRTTRSPTIKTETVESPTISRSQTIETYDEYVNEDDGYEPSAELAAAFAAMINASASSTPVVKDEPKFIKSEPQDLDMESLFGYVPKSPGVHDRSRSLTLGREGLGALEPRQVKQETARQRILGSGGSSSRSTISGARDPRRTYGSSQYSPTTPPHIFVKPEPIEAALPLSVENSTHYNSTGTYPANCDSLDRFLNEIEGHKRRLGEMNGVDRSNKNELHDGGLQSLAQMRLKKVKREE